MFLKLCFAHQVADVQGKRTRRCIRLCKLAPLGFSLLQQLLSSHG